MEGEKREKDPNNYDKTFFRLYDDFKWYSYVKFGNNENFKLPRINR